MSLIDELGGYECAKAEYSDPMYKDDEPYTVKATGTRFFKQNLGDELLEHRRANNIFEVGDKVVYRQNIAPEHNNIYEVWKIDLVGCLILLGDMDYRAIYNQIRHTTDEEIKAGGRLKANPIDSDIDKQVNLMDQFIADGGFDKAFVDVFGLPESVVKSLKDVS